MKDNGSMKKLFSIATDSPPAVAEDDKKSKSKEREKAVSVTKIGKKGKKTAVAVEGQYMY